jgi:hypothetical protein
MGLNRFEEFRYAGESESLVLGFFKMERIKRFGAVQNSVVRRILVKVLECEMVQIHVSFFVAPPVLDPFQKIVHTFRVSIHLPHRCSKQGDASAFVLHHLTLAITKKQSVCV